MRVIAIIFLLLSLTGFGQRVCSTDTIPMSCYTTYHYRAKTINATGISYGEDKTFVTLEE